MDAQRRRVLAAAVAILLLAAILRLYYLASVPFGWHVDEASKAVIAREVLAGQCCPAFFGQFTGREALYIYLEAGLLAIVRDPLFAGRLVSANLGLLTIAAIVALGRELYSRRVALLAAGFAAVSLWHLIASRNGYRAVSQPPFEALTLLALLRGWRSGRRGQFALAGFWLAVTLYTYTAARAFPVAAALAVLWLWWCRPRTRPWGQLAVLAAVFVVAAGPLALHFWQHPEQLTTRTAQISIFSPEWNRGDLGGLLFKNLSDTLGMFFWRGDPNYRFNLGDAPVFDPLSAALFAVGLILCLWHVWRGDVRQKRAAGVTLLIIGVMLLPMYLSAESLPYYQRAVGILPVLFFVPALGADGLWRRLPGRLAPPLMLSLLAGLGGLSAYNYFARWAVARRNYDDRYVLLVQAADYLRTIAAAAHPYVSTQYETNPTLALLSPETYDRSTRFDGSRALVFPPAGEGAEYLLLADAPLAAEFRDRLQAASLVESRLDPFGRTAFEVVRWPASAARPAPQRTDGLWASFETSFGEQRIGQAVSAPVDLGAEVLLLGYDRAGDTFQAGQNVTVLLYWQVQRTPASSYSSFVHVLDANAQEAANVDQLGYSPRYWRPGELFITRYELRLPAELGAGTYQMEAGIYEPASGERLPVLDPAGTMLANRLLLEPLTVE